MAKVDRFEDLIIWQEAKELVLEVYAIIKETKDFGFKDQIQRATVSIMNNIAEGFERSSDADFKRFLYMAKASCGEVRSMLYLSFELNYINDASFQTLKSKAIKLSSGIMNFIKYLNK